MNYGYLFLVLFFQYIPLLVLDGSFMRYGNCEKCLSLKTSSDFKTIGELRFEAVKWMTSSNILKYVVSYDGTTNEVAPDVFEYSVFGSPQQKIGDFTQTKWGGF